MPLAFMVLAVCVSLSYWRAAARGDVTWATMKGGATERGFCIITHDSAWLTSHDGAIRRCVPIKLMTEMLLEGSTKLGVR